MSAEPPLTATFAHRQQSSLSSVVSPFRPGSIFYNDSTALSSINNTHSSEKKTSIESSPTPTTIDNNTDCPPSLLNSSSPPSANKKYHAFLSTADPAVIPLASPPPSPSRNSIFDQPWSSFSGPNISSLRASVVAPPPLGTEPPNTPVHSPLAFRTPHYSYITNTTAPSTYSSKIHLHNKRSLASDTDTPAPRTTTEAGAVTNDASRVILSTKGPLDSYEINSVGRLGTNHYKNRGQQLTSAAVGSIPVTESIDTNNNYQRQEVGAKPFKGDPQSTARIQQTPADERSSNESTSICTLRSPAHMPRSHPSPSVSLSTHSSQPSSSASLSSQLLADMPASLLTDDSKTWSSVDRRGLRSAFSLDLDRSKAHLLGHGLNAEVYKAWMHPSSASMREYLSSRKTMQSLTCNGIFQGDKNVNLEQQEESTQESAVLCAAKCLFKDADSQSVGLAEAEILRRLHAEQAHHPGRKHLVDFYGLYDNITKQGLSPDEIIHIDKISHTQDQEPEWILLLENCQNGTVWDWIRHHPERVDYRQWLTWAIQLLEAIDCIHEAGLVHHDIKPHNILLDSSLDVKLSDFGASLFLTNVKGSKDSMHFGLEDGLGRGTPPYSAPEMFASVTGGAHYGQSIDIYSLGVTLYVIGLTAQEPFHKLKSVIEMMVWIKKGGFWMWEDQRWAHDRGQVPKIILTNRSSTSSTSQAQGVQPVNPSQGRPLDRQSSDAALRASSSNSLAPPPHLPRINTQLCRDQDMLDLSSASSMNSPGTYIAGTFTTYPASPRNHFLHGHSPDRSLKPYAPSTPVSPSPLPSPQIKSRSSSMSLRKEEPRRKSGEVVMRFLNGDVVPQDVISLLKEMCQADPEKRPNAQQILQRLREMQDQFDAETEEGRMEGVNEEEEGEGQVMEVDITM